MCHFMLKKPKVRGAQYHGSCTVETLMKDGQGNLSAVKLDNGDIIACSKLGLTSGSWTPAIFKQLFTELKSAQLRINDIGTLGGHAIIVMSPHWKSANQEGRFPSGCHAVFAKGFSGSTSVTGSKSFAPVSNVGMPACVVISDIVHSAGDLLSIAGRALHWRSEHTRLSSSRKSGSEYDQ